MIKRFITRNPLIFYGVLIVIALVFTSFTAQWLAPFDPIQQSLPDRLLPPSLRHWMGTDQYGRDVFSRLLYGSRVSLAVGVVATSLLILVGTLIGALSGYYGRFMDGALMRFTDVFLCIPTLVLILMVIALAGPGILNVMIVIGLTSWPGVARLVRGEFLALKEREFVQAARLIGMSDARVILRHLLPNAAGPILVAATLGIGSSILTESALSFLGLGIQPPTPSWGSMLMEGKEHLTDAWWLATFPGFAILLTVMGFNLIGEGLRDLMDPRLKGSGRRG